MTLQENKRVAAQLFECFSASDIAGAMDLLTDDVSWRVAGKPELSPAAGNYDKERLQRLFHRLLKQLKQGLRITVASSIAEGDRVAVEVKSRGDLQNGREYRQQYHFLLVFRDGRIASVHEYLDTQHAFEVWMRPAT